MAQPSPQIIKHFIGYMNAKRFHYKLRKYVWQQQ
jgi:hypothetical protein